MHPFILKRSMILLVFFTFSYIFRTSMESTFTAGFILTAEMKNEELGRQLRILVRDLTV